MIPANGELKYECTVSLHAAGEFELPLSVYLEDNGIREVKLTVRGVGIDAENLHEKKSKS